MRLHFNDGFSKIVLSRDFLLEVDDRGGFKKATVGARAPIIFDAEPENLYRKLVKDGQILKRAPTEMKLCWVLWFVGQL